MIPNERLVQAAEQAAMLLNDSLPPLEHCRHLFSNRFRRKMDRILRRQKHPAFYRCLRIAAVFLLILTVCFGSLLALSAEAREFVFGWVREHCGIFYHYYFSGEANNGEKTQYRPGWLPDGYVLDSVTEFPGGKSYLYYDESGRTATFIYTSQTDETELYIQCTEFEQKDVTINGLPGKLYLAPDEKDASEVVWMDPTNSIMFNLGAHVREDILIKMAENIVVKK